jgi:hypothetical protein
MITVKATAHCDGYNYRTCDDAATYDIELMLQETRDDVGDDLRIPHLKTVALNTPRDWLITGDYIVPQVVRCPACLVKEREYNKRVDKNAGLKGRK